MTQIHRTQHQRAPHRAVAVRPRAHTAPEQAPAASVGEVALATGALAAARSWSKTITHGAGFKPIEAVPSMLLGAGVGAVGAVATNAVADQLHVARSDAHLAAAGVGTAAALLGRKLLHGAGGQLISSAGTALAATSVAGLGFDITHQAIGVKASKALESLPTDIAIGGAVAGVGLAGVKFGPRIARILHGSNVVPGGAEADAAGAKLGELVPRSKLTIAGRMFLDSRSPGVGSSAVRTYMPYKLDGMSRAERIALTIKSMEHQGAFAKSTINVISPTGTGSVNLGPTVMQEMLTKGDVATVVAQYGKQPSIYSIFKTDKASEDYIELVRAIVKRRDELHPSGNGPRITGSATSLGTLNIHKALHRYGDELLHGKADMKFLLLGVPEGLSPLDVSKLPAGTLARFRSEDEVRAASPAVLREAKLLEQSHINDPVRTMSWGIAYDRSKLPDTTGRLPSEGGAKRPFTPITSLLQHGDDVMTAIARGTDSSMDQIGHDYRLDDPAILAEWLGMHDVDPKRLADAAKTAQDVLVANAKRAEVLTGAAPAPAKG